MRLDALLELMEDGPDGQIVLELLERLFDFGELDVMAPQLGGVFTGHVGAQQVAALTAKHLSQLLSTKAVGEPVGGQLFVGVRDFEARYHYRPWLVETFVAPAHDGASFRAANFVCVGPTAGRGRGDRAHDRTPTVKSVYMYALAAHWRRTLGVARVEAAPSLGPGEGLDSAQWAQNELGGAPLGDKRLSARLVRSATVLALCPGHAFTGAPDRVAMKGYYRLIDHPDESQVTPEHIVAPHRARTIERMRAHDTVLCIQDGTDLNFATRPGCEGLSIIGRNQTAAKTLGLHLHLTLAVSGAGLPLGGAALRVR